MKKLSPLVPVRGNLYTYRILRPTFRHRKPGFFALDLGFRIKKEAELVRVRNPQPEEIVQSIRTVEHPCGDRHIFKRRSDLTVKAVHTYVCRVTDVVDLDTYWVDIDLGFRDIAYDQKIRLRGIDAKELGRGGEKGLQWLRKLLLGLPFVVCKFFYRDKWGRPLTDLFYLKGTRDSEKVLREGIYLNQELLDLGLAQRV